MKTKIKREYREILEFIHDYQKPSDKVVKIFRDKYKIYDFLRAALVDRILPYTGDIKEAGISEYYYHSGGISAKLHNYHISTQFFYNYYNFDNDNTDYSVEIRHDCFTTWRLHLFAKQKPKKYQKFVDWMRLDKYFEDLVRDNIIYKPNVRNGTEVYFLRSSPPIREKV